MRFILPDERPDRFIDRLNAWMVLVFDDADEEQGTGFGAPCWAWLGILICLAGLGAWALALLAASLFHAPFGAVFAAAMAVLFVAPTVRIGWGYYR